MRETAHRKKKLDKKVTLEKINDDDEEYSELDEIDVRDD